MVFSESTVTYNNTSDNYDSSSPHPREVSRVFETMVEILAASDAIQRDEETKPRLPIATLDRASVLSKWLWEQVLVIPPFSIPHFQRSLTRYKLILVDIQQILSSKDPLEISDGKIDCRLDEFVLQFQEALDFIKGPISERSLPNSTHFFENSHHMVISGGNFSSNPVLHDPIVREQAHKILQVVYIQCGVLFV